MAHGPIVLVGGLMSLPWRYRGFAEILREVSGSEVYVAPITPLDWILGRIRGYGQLVFEVASTVDRALLESESHLITLGSPHVVSDKNSLAPIAQVNDLFPGALHEPAGLKYLSVAGGAAHGASYSRVRRRYERLIEDGRVAGDGVVPVESALLPGSETVVLDDLYHSHYFGRWYGSDRETVEKWWPQDLRVNANLVGEHRA